jgi:hypothetical protein
MRSAALLRPKYSARPRPTRPRLPRRANALKTLILLSFATPATSLALRTNFVARLAAPLAPLTTNDMWTGARASTQPPPDAPLDAEAIEAARVRAAGHAHLHNTIASVARATTRRLDGVKAPLTVVGDAYKNNVLRFRKLWRRDPAAPALCLDDPQALLVIRRP